MAKDNRTAAREWAITMISAQDADGLRMLARYCKDFAEVFKGEMHFTEGRVLSLPSQAMHMYDQFAGTCSLALREMPGDGRRAIDLFAREVLFNLPASAV